MRTLIVLTLTALLAPTARGQNPGRAVTEKGIDETKARIDRLEETDASRALIEKAVQAHGGASALDKYPAGRAKAKGTITLRGTEYPFNLERVFQSPNKLKITSDVVIMNIHRPVTCAVNGNAVTALAGGLAQELPRSQVEELRTAVYVQNICRLTPLLKDKKFTLAAAGEKEFDGKPTVGVIVNSEGHKGVRLYFDKQTNLLTALERPGFDDRGKAVDHVEVYGGYREANGLKYPTKTTVRQNGKKYLESETTEFQPLPKIDSREFQIVAS
jgi:hypothetical protein